MLGAFDAESLPEAIKTIFRNNHYNVEGPINIHGASVDIVATSIGDPFRSSIYIEATIEYVDNDKYGKDMTKLALIREKYPDATLLIVSSKGFTDSVKERASQTRIKTMTYSELFSQFERFDQYIQTILGLSPIATSLQALDSIYEEPYFNDKHGKDNAIDFLNEWLCKYTSRNRWLIVVGEYGTGKTALTRILQYRWTDMYRINPSLPIPFRIELRDFSRQFDAQSLIHHFLDNNNLGHVSIQFVYSLIRSGRVVLLLDGYDEMAQYLHSRERRACLETLASLSSDGARGILTSRPNYFTETEEFQVFEVLYSSFQKGAFFLSKTSREIIEQEKRIDDLIQAQFLDRYERYLRDLDHDQTERLIKRSLNNDPEGCNIVIDLIRQIFRDGEGESSTSLSGKPVIISYLLEVVDELKERPDARTMPLTEWNIYKLIMDNLMVRDIKRGGLVLPDRRRDFLRQLALILSDRDCPDINENDFRQLIKKIFIDDIRRIHPEDPDRGLDLFFSDLRSSGSLTRSIDTVSHGWKFSHNSLREYLVTELLIKGLESGNICPTLLPISSAMRKFAASLDNDRLKILITFLQKQLLNTHNVRGIGQLLILLWDGFVPLFSQEPDSIKYLLQTLTDQKITLKNLTLKNLNFSYEDNPTDLENATFDNCELSYCFFNYANCIKCQFINTAMDNVSFFNCNLTNANFSNCLMIEVNFVDSILTEANFLGVDNDISIIIEINEENSKVSKLEGLDAIGYLNFHGAITDTIDDIYIFQHHRYFSIIHKICDYLRVGTASQIRGLTQRGAARQNIVFAGNFLNELIRTDLCITKDNRPGMIYPTKAGREVFSKLCERKSIAPVIVDFLKRNS